MKQKVLVANHEEMFCQNDRDFNWVQKGNILGVASTGDAFVSLVGDRKCTTYASVIILDIDYRGIVRESLVKNFGVVLNDADIDELVEENMKAIRRAIKLVESQ